MGQIQVTAAQLQNVKDNFNSLVSKFKSTIETAQSQANALLAVWEGDAADAFKMAFSGDIARLDASAQALAGFVSALDTIIAQYQNTEASNVKIAQGL